MRLALAAGLMALIWFGTSARAAEPPPVPLPVVVEHAPADAHAQPISLAKIVSDIPVGTPWADFRSKSPAFGFICGTPLSSGLTWQATGKEFDRATYGGILSAELSAAGFSGDEAGDDLFKTRKIETDLLLAGNVKEIKAQLCLRPTFFIQPNDYKPPPLGSADLDQALGWVSYTIEWEVYSKSQDKVIFKTVTQGGLNFPRPAPGNFARLITGGVRENIRILLNNSDFRALLLAAQSKPVLKTMTQTPLSLTGSLAAKPEKIAEAVGSVVLVLTSEGHGSGVLVSSDGYVLTDDHVVGEEKYVKIRWSDGLEGLGEVIRRDKRRDVALIKTDPRGRLPLPLRAQPPEPGDTVFAIGAPEETRLQSTVTRGVISAANRIVDGFSFIQSDVTVNPGNSGGPLLNEKGEVLGLTDWKLQTRDNATGLNFFTPIGDALAFLSLEQR